MAFDFARWLAYRKYTDPDWNDDLKVINAKVGATTSEGDLVHIGNYHCEKAAFRRQVRKGHRQRTRHET